MLPERGRAIGALHQDGLAATAAADEAHLLWRRQMPAPKWYPIEELRTALGQDGSVDVVAVKHELGASKTVADEFNATVRVMRQRHMPQAVFEDILHR